MKGSHVNVHTVSETAETLLPFGIKKKKSCLLVSCLKIWRKKNTVIGYFMLC